MTTQHTPGPWAFAEYASGPTIYGSDNSAIARIEQWKGGYETAQEANARLIAASPDLLAALQHLLADARACDMDIGQYSGSLIEARAAIAKATGAYMPRKAYCLALLDEARAHLARHDVVAARACLSIWRCEYNCAPKSTQRRWRCSR